MIDRPDTMPGVPPLPPPTGPPVTWAPPVSGPSFAPKRPPHDTLPWQAGVGAVVVLAVSLLASKWVLEALVELGWPIVAYVLVLAAIAYGPSLVWWWYASRRWGSGHPIRDVGARPRWSDLGWGPLVWLAAIATQIAIAALVLATGIPLSNNTDGVDELAADRAYVVAIVVTAVLVAPLVEEIVFRGLVLRGFLDIMAAPVAIALQGVIFGVAHVDPVRGSGNVGLALVLSGVGIAFGGFAHLLRRIGPTIVAHAIFNGVVMVLVLTGVADRLREENDPFSTGLDRSVGEQVAIVDQADIVEPDGGRDAHRSR